MSMSISSSSFAELLEGALLAFLIYKFYSSGKLSSTFAIPGRLNFEAKVSRVRYLHFEVKEGMLFTSNTDSTFANQRKKNKNTTLK